jgi:phosphoglycolate phosphatase
MAPTHATIVFDLDGTLVDTAPDLVNALNDALALEGIAEPITVEEARTLIGAGARALLARGLSARGRRVSDERFETLHKRFLSHYRENIAAQSRPFPGVEAALDRLAGAGHLLSVCTNKTEALAVILLRELNLHHRFATIVGGDTLPVQKPDPEPLLAAISRAGGVEGQAVLVGDSTTDFYTARNAGVPIVGVTFGYTDKPMAELRPDRLIQHFDELVPAVEQILAG